MLSVEKCKEFLKGREYTAQEIEETRNSLYQLASILVSKFMDEKQGAE
jgi:hypothetical protein